MNILQSECILPSFQSTPLHHLLSLPPLSPAHSYETSRAHVDAVFGLQFNTSFPNMLRPCDTECGCGGFPSTSNSRYNNGIDLLVSATTEVCPTCQPHPQPVCAIPSLCILQCLKLTDKCTYRSSTCTVRTYSAVFSIFTAHHEASIVLLLIYCAPSLGLLV